MFNLYQFKKNKKDSEYDKRRSVKEEKQLLEHKLLNEDLNFNHNVKIRDFIHQIWKNPIVIGDKKIEKEEMNNVDAAGFSFISLLKGKISSLKKINKLDHLPENVKFIDEQYKKELSKLREEKRLKEENKRRKKEEDTSHLVANPVEGNMFFGTITKEINNLSKSSVIKPQLNSKEHRKPKVYSVDLSKYNLNENKKYRTYFQSVKTLACSTSDAQDRINIEKFKTQKYFNSTQAQKKVSKGQSGSLSLHNLRKISFYAEPMEKPKFTSKNRNYNYKQTNEIEHLVNDLKATVPEITKVSPPLLDLKADYYDDINTAYMNEYDREKFSPENLEKIKKMFAVEKTSYYDKLFKSKALRKSNPFSQMIQKDPKKYFKVFSVVDAKPITKGNETMDIDGKKYNYTEIKQISKVLLRKCRVIK